MLEIRKTVEKDLERIEEIFVCARERMKQEGNPTQWGTDRPSLDLVRKDIAEGCSYVVMEDGKTVATFAYPIGIEPTYLQIDGEWLDDAPYGTIHRIASDGSVHGIFEAVLEYVESFGIDVCIDTHRDNRTMIHLIESNGFHRCGIIIVDDGTPRIAYQKKI
jgi:hypothetical protein